MMVSMTRLGLGWGRAMARTPVTRRVGRARVESFIVLGNAGCRYDCGFEKVESRKTLMMACLRTGFGGETAVIL